MGVAPNRKGMKEEPALNWGNLYAAVEDVCLFHDYDHNGISKTARKVVKAIFAHIVRETLQGRRVNIIGLGTFYMRPTRGHRYKTIKPDYVPTPGMRLSFETSRHLRRTLIDPTTDLKVP